MSSFLNVFFYVIDGIEMCKYEKDGVPYSQKFLFQCYGKWKKGKATIANNQIIETSKR